LSVTEAAKYFDRERIEADPSSTYLSPLGQRKIIEWMEVLEANHYTVDSPLEIADSAGWLVANGYSDIDVTSTRIMLAFLSNILDLMDDLDAAA
jgi:hypothetical protein